MSFVGHEQAVELLLHLAFNLRLLLFKQAVGNFLEERFELDEGIIFQIRLLLNLNIEAMYPVF